jgi:hypothetical protein
MTVAIIIIIINHQAAHRRVDEWDNIWREQFIPSSNQNAKICIHDYKQ